MYVSYSLNKFVTVFKGLFATGNRFYLDHLKRNEIYVKIYEDIYYITTWTYVFVESRYCYSL